jgi:hypothetical protein
MGRPPIGKKAMSNAQRQANYRARLREEAEERERRRQEREERAKGKAERRRRVKDREWGRKHAGPWNFEEEVRKTFGQFGIGTTPTPDLTDEDRALRACAKRRGVGIGIAA